MSPTIPTLLAAEAVIERSASHAPRTFGARTDHRRRNPKALSTKACALTLAPHHPETQECRHEFLTGSLIQLVQSRWFV